MPFAMGKAASENTRCVTGIEGLDNILGGGVPAGNMVLVSGGPGTGKTTLAFEFLVRGALAGESGVLITTTESPQRIVANIPQFAFYNDKLVKDGKITILDLKQLYETVGITNNIDANSIDLLCSAIGKVVSAAKVKRLVIDSFAPVIRSLSDPGLEAALLTGLSAVFSANHCTALLVSSRMLRSGGEGSVEGDVADGIVLLANFDRRGDTLRTMQVTKMKGTSHSRVRYVIDLTPYGVLVTPMIKGGS
jgi:circadian clock protein KaiC